MGKSGREKRVKRERERADGDGTRTLRLQELIREEVNFLLRSEVCDPHLDGVTITMVELAGECARLWFTQHGNEDSNEDDSTHKRNVDEAWARVAGFLRTRLAESLGLKRTPELRFRRDPTTTRI
jgi:ribosome-binding factor A